MKALKTEERMPGLEQVRHLQKGPSGGRLYRWPGWHPFLASLQLLAILWLFLYSGPLLRLIDSGAACLDAGILSILLADLLIVHAFVLSAWMLVKLIRGVITGFYVKDELTKGFTQKFRTCLDTKMFTAFWGLLVLFCWVFWVLV